MKKICFILALATLGACSSEENLPSNEKSEIRLTSEVTPMSRGTDLSQQSTQIVNGQKVGVTIIGAKSIHNNVAWLVGDNGEMTNTGATVYWGDEDVSVTAYHPYQSIWDNESYFTFHVQTDQTGQGYLDSDLLWAVTNSVKNNKAANPIALNFVHKLSKINVSLTSTESYDLSNAIITICGTNLYTSFDPTTGNTSRSNTSSIREIIAGVTTANAPHASAIIVPQTVAANTRFIQVQLADRFYFYKLPAEKTFESGKSYTYTLTVKNAEELTCSSSDISEWDNGGETVGTGDEEKVLSVTTTKAGTLSTLLGEQKNNIEMLKISGPINGDDIGCLRQMLGGTSDSETHGILSILDLSEATIEAGGSYKLYSTSESYVTKANELSHLEFERCQNLRQLTIPNTLEKITGPLGKLCAHLTHIIAKENNLNFSSFDGILYNKDKSLLIRCPFIKPYVYIPNTVTKISILAFFSCLFTEVIEIPSNTSEIPIACFHECHELMEINVAKDNQTYNSQDGILYNKDKTKLIKCPARKEKLIIPDGVITIGENAVFSSEYLNSVTIPNSVTTIENDAFRDCVNLENIYCRVVTPLTISNNVFNLNSKDKTILHVPAESVEAYTEAWGTYFKEVKAL